LIETFRCLTKRVCLTTRQEEKEEKGEKEEKEEREGVDPIMRLYPGE